MMKSKGVFSIMMKPFKIFSDKEGSKEADLQKFAAQEQKQFAYETLCKATDKFHSSRKLGEGGFGPVFKGILADGREVAVKMLSKNSRQGQREFINEAKLLARVQHRNVVNLLGYCAHGEEKLLVYEYVSNESLDKFLFKPDKRHLLDWKKRYDIISGIARGLVYLHEDSHSCIIHRDIKASNVLLDDKWIPKIADFGMARLFPEDQTHVNTRVAGTNGYMAPEYVMHGHLSVKADVFSFGVLMLELISGRRNSSHSLSLDDQNLLDWAYKLFKRSKTLEVLDPTIASTAIAEQVALCVQIGLLCTQSDPSLRPAMRRVIGLLSKKPTSLEEPSRPGFPGSRYRKPRHPGASGSNSSTMSMSSSLETNRSSSIMSATATTTTPRSVRYVAIYFAILFIRQRAGIVTDEMLAIPKSHFVFIGFLEALGLAGGMASAAMIPGPAIPVLNQTFLVWQLCLSSIILGKRYSFMQIVGCLLVATGVVVAVSSGSGGGHILSGVELVWPAIMIASGAFHAGASILKEFVFVDAATRLKGKTLDIFVVNSFGSGCQALFVLLMLPVLSNLKGIPFPELPLYLKSGAACFVKGCDGAPLLPLLYVGSNIAFNISVLNLLKIAGAVVASLVTMVSVPISIYILSLPLPYLPESGSLGLSFVLGSVILMSGLVLYNLPQGSKKQPLT
ncbi:hypothetical protein KSS87_011009 [Heliosperma pusillum]|nr:hypothetical protein KSS87_011009 [Heliosperma pusillum]